MPKQCAECRSVVNTEAPYCDACGYTFSNTTAPSMTWDLKLFLSALAISAVAIIVVGILRVL